MPKVVVTYFHLKGLGESIRMILSYAGQEFEDRRISKNDWPELKPKTPFQQLPLLEIDGKVYAQSIPIARYLGKKYGLAGADIEEDFEIDQNIALLSDFLQAAMMVWSEEDPEAKKKKQEVNEKEKYPFFLNKFCELLEKNNGHIALGKLTWGDFVLAGCYETIKMIVQSPDFEKQYPALKKLQEFVRSLPGVKEFVANAPPDTHFNN